MSKSSKKRITYNKEVFKERFKKLKNDNNISMRDISIMPLSRLNNIVYGNQNTITISDLDDICDFFSPFYINGVNRDYLLGESDEIEKDRDGFSHTHAFLFNNNFLPMKEYLISYINNDNNYEFLNSIYYILTLPDEDRKKVVNSINNLVSVFKQTTFINREDGLNSEECKYIIEGFRNDDIYFKELNHAYYKAIETENNGNYEVALKEYFSILARSLCNTYTKQTVISSEQDANIVGNNAAKRIKLLIGLQTSLPDEFYEYDEFYDLLFQVGASIHKQIQNKNLKDLFNSLESASAKSSINWNSSINDILNLDYIKQLLSGKGKEFKDEIIKYHLRCRLKHYLEACEVSFQLIDKISNL